LGRELFYSNDFIWLLSLTNAHHNNGEQWSLFMSRGLDNPMVACANLDILLDHTPSL